MFTILMNRARSVVMGCGFFLGLLIVLSGCVATTTDIDRLQGDLNQLQKTQADLTFKIDTLNRTIGVLNENLMENQKQMGQLSLHLEDTQTRLVSEMRLITDLLSAATQQAVISVPSESYRAAYQDYLSGKFDLAIEGFNIFLSRYPQSDLAEDAQFYLADSYLSAHDYEKARMAFDKTLASSKKYRAAALLKRATALKKAGNSEAAQDTLEVLIKELPESNESKNAAEWLEKWRKDAEAARQKAEKARKEKAVVEQKKSQKKNSEAAPR